MIDNESESIRTFPGDPDPQESVEKDEFNNWLVNKISRQSKMVSRAHGEKVIQYLREERENGADSANLKSKFTSGFRFQVKKRKFRLINVVGLGDILCLPIKDDKKQPSHAMLGQHRQVIFKEDMYDVINSAHVNGERHRGYKGTYNKINATYCNIPREVVSKFVSMCKFCQKAHACFAPYTLKKGEGKGKQKKKKTNDVKKKEIEMAFLTRCQVDILDMQSFSDSEGQFSYLLHFLDHHTKYNVLIPLKRTDALYVAKKLCRYVFGHFGLPRIVHSNLGRKYVDEVISWILQLWSTDAHILNGNPRFKKILSFIQQRQKTVMMLIETIRAKQPDATNWSSWLPGIQYSLNTNQFEAESPASYYAVYSRRPKVYTYSSNSKDIPREEDVIEESVTDETTINMNELLTMSDLLQNNPETILISQLPAENQMNTSLEPAKDINEMELKNADTTLQAELLNASALGAIPLSLGDQHFTLIGTNLAVGGQTIQIPVMNIGNTHLTIQSVQDDPGSSTKTLLHTNASQSFQLHDNASLTLTNDNQASLGLPPDEETLCLDNQGQTGSLGLDEQGNSSLGIHNDADDSTLGLNDDALISLASHSVNDGLEIGNLKMVDLNNTSDGGDVSNDSNCFQIKQDPPSSFSMTTLENEINVGANEEESYQ